MSEEFYRIKRLPPYVIAEVNAMRAAARAAGEDIIDLGMGNPDLPPPPHVIAKLCEVASKPDAHGYSASKGIAGLRKAQAGYYARRFGVDLDPESEVVVTLGSKEGLANLAQAITAPGDVILAPNPSYPIHTFGFIIAGATIRSVPTTPDERYFEALERAMKFTVPKPSVLVMGYPSNPTAEVVDLAFYERVVAFAKQHGLWVLSDLAYSELYFDGCPTPSILQVPGAKDVAVEFTSMSKTYSMAGWRIGFAAAPAHVIKAMDAIQGQTTSSANSIAQWATIAALNDSKAYIESARAAFFERRNAIVAGLNRVSCPTPTPDGAFYVLADTTRIHSDETEAARMILEQAKVAVVPGTDFRAFGKVRLSYACSLEQIAEAVRRIGLLTA